MNESRLAINSISTKDAGLVECLPAYRKAGFRNVELAVSHIRHFEEGGGTVSMLKSMLDENGLSCIGGFEKPVLCFAPDSEREENHDLTVRNARLLSELGGSVLVVGTDGPAKDIPVADPLGVIASVFGELAEKTRDLGVTLCLEFNWSPLVKSFRTAAEIARRSQALNVGVLFDLAHYHCTPTKLVELSPENVATIRHVHVDDMKDKPAELSNCNSDRVLPGQGCLDVAGILGLIEKQGYNGYFAIEMFSKDLWALPVEESSRRMYESLLTLCDERSPGASLGL